MSTGKKILSPYVLANGTDLGATVSTNPVSLQYMDRICVEIILTGTPTGAIALQVSNDYIPPNQLITPSVTPANWYDLPLAMVAPSGGPETYFIDAQVTSIPWFRVTYTRTGGAGNMTVVITAKES